MDNASLRHENLKFFVQHLYNSQTDFANYLNHPTLTQPIISAILRRKRTFHTYEVREIEKIMGIPENWIDKYPMQKAMPHIKKLNKLNPDTQVIFYDVLKFMDNNKCL